MRICAPDPACTRAKRRLNCFAPRMADADTRHRNAIAEQRLAALQMWWRLREAGHPAGKAAELMGGNLRTLQRWAALHRKGELAPKSSRPRSTRHRSWTPELRQAVHAIRSEPLQRTWGPDKLLPKLQQSGFKTSRSTVSRILRLLKDCRALPLRARGNIGRKRRSRKRPHATRRPKNFRAPRPGEMVQVGSLHLRCLPTLCVCPMTVYDPVSKCTSARQVKSLTARNMCGAMRDILDTFPVPITGVQVDNGAEYRGAFEQLLRERGIPMQTITPRSPRENAAVERNQRTWREECYQSWSAARNIQQLRADSGVFQHHHNHHRPHHALAGLTPMQYLEKHHSGILRRTEGDANQPNSETAPR